MHKFDPALNSAKTQKILEGVYIPNEPVSVENHEMYVNEFIRLRGNFDQGEPREDTIV